MSDHLKKPKLKSVIVTFKSGIKSVFMAEEIREEIGIYTIERVTDGVMLSTVRPSKSSVFEVISTITMFTRNSKSRSYSKVDCTISVKDDNGQSAAFIIDQARDICYDLETKLAELC